MVLCVVVVCPAAGRRAWGAARVGGGRGAATSTLLLQVRGRQAGRQGEAVVGADGRPVLPPSPCRFALGLLYPASSCAALSSLPWTLLRPPVHEPDVGLVSLEHKKRRVGGGRCVRACWAGSAY